MDLDECKRKGIIRKVAVNKNRAMSIIEISSIKSKTVMSADINEENIIAFLPMAYDSLREMLEAYGFLQGYNVSNHECLGRLIKELLPEFDGIAFDRFRFVRNSINYYGEKINLEEGKILIEKMLRMSGDILIKIKEEVTK